MFYGSSVEDTGCAELVIRILEDNSNCDTASNSQVFLLSIPRKESITVQNLKRRIGGKLSTDCENVTLLYNGELLYDLDIKGGITFQNLLCNYLLIIGKPTRVPLESFEPFINPVEENNDNGNGDYLIFRSRIWAYVSPTHQDDNNVVEDNESFRNFGDEITEIIHNNDVDEPFHIEISHIPKFNLEHELKLIECSQHFRLIEDAGYSDIGLNIEYTLIRNVYNTN